MIVVRNMAKVLLPERVRYQVLSLYSHESKRGKIVNYKYSGGVAYLPLNPNKLQRVADLLNEEVSDQRNQGAPLQSPFVLNPSFIFREHQVVPARKLEIETRKKKCAVIQAGCGLGKTVVMSYVGGTLRKKILVLVDMGSLVSQWQDAFQMVWGRSAQILDRASCDFQDICITTFQLLHTNPQLLNRMTKEFGTLLLDEFHTTQTDTRREILFRLDVQYRIGCTATPWKKGYGDAVLTDLVADVSIVMEDKKALKPDVHFFETGVGFCSLDPNDWGAIQSQLSKELARNALLLQLLRKLAAMDRKVLFIGSTIKQCRVIASALKRDPNCRPVVYTGSTTLKQDHKLRQDLEDGAINTILTVKKADKGLDLPLLDTLVASRPSNDKAFVTQTGGRIVRVREGKPPPWIFDAVDVGSLASSFANNRADWYTQLGYEVKGTIRLGTLASFFMPYIID